MNAPDLTAPNGSQSIQVVIHRLADGYSVAISTMDGTLTQLLLQATVASFLEAEKTAHTYAAKHRIPWHKVAMTCR